MKHLLIALCLLTAAAFADDVNVTLKWDANVEPDIDYYNLKIGTAKGVYTQTIMVKDAVQKTVGLPEKQMYYAILTAVNTSGLESMPSKEFVFQAAKAADLKMPSPPSNISKPSVLQVSLQKSNNLTAWVDIGPVLLVKPEGIEFYRTLLTDNR